MPLNALRKNAISLKEFKYLVKTTSSLPEEKISLIVLTKLLIAPKQWKQISSFSLQYKAHNGFDLYVIT